MLGLYASIRLLGAGIDIRCHAVLLISLEPAELDLGIHAFSRKVNTVISENLYKVFGETGKIHTSIILDVTHCGGMLGYRKQVSEKPSQLLFTKVESTVDSIVNEMERDLAFAIVKKEEFKAQRISCTPRAKRK